MSDLFQRITSEPALREAWARVREGGKAPGLDGVSLEQFDFHAEREIARLRRELRTGTYRPYPARRVHIPKAEGGVRRIGIQAVRDRVAQRALHQALQPRAEPTLEDAAHAFRPRRGVETALTRLELFRQQGLEWAGRADVAVCFDSLDRPLLEQRLATVLPEPDARALVRLWLTAGYVDETGWRDDGIGVLQGDVLSPLLCNLYLDPFDEALQRAGFGLVRYADDFVILAPSEARARQGLDRAAAVLEGLRLKLNPRKSLVTSFTRGFEYLGAGIVGALRLPLHRQEMPPDWAGPPRYTYGYGPVREIPRRRPRAPAVPLARSEAQLQRLFIHLLRQERDGRPLPPVAAAFLRAWEEAGHVPPPPEPEPHGWQSVYLI